jgi:hypothetical protein
MEKRAIKPRKAMKTAILISDSEVSDCLPRSNKGVLRRCRNRMPALPRRGAAELPKATVSSRSTKSTPRIPNTRLLRSDIQCDPACSMLKVRDQRKLCGNPHLRADGSV